MQVRNAHFGLTEPFVLPAERLLSQMPIRQPRTHAPRPARDPSHARDHPPKPQPAYSHLYRRLAQNADHLAHSGPFSAFFAEVVCSFGTTSAPDAASAPARRTRSARACSAMPQDPHATAPAPDKFAHNFRRSLFEHTRKHCNSNDLLSRLEAPAVELRATLPEPMNIARNDDYPRCIATTFPHRSS